MRIVVVVLVLVVGTKLNYLRRLWCFSESSGYFYNKGIIFG